MAYDSGTKFTAQDFIDLKARVKAEMKRRKGTTSLTAYAGTTYDYTTTPAQDSKILEEHIDKLTVPMSKVNFTQIGDQAQGDLVKNMTTLNATLTSYEGAKETSSTYYCKQACAGLCSSGCYTTCSGCSGTCSGTCSGGCTDACTSCTSCWSCSGSCEGGCSGMCSGSCWFSCDVACADYSW